MRRSKLRTTPLSAAVVAAFAVSAMLSAPTSFAEPGNTVCEPGQIVIDGQCNMPAAPPNIAPAPPYGSGSGMGSGDNGSVHPR